MQIELVKDALYKGYRAAVETLIAAGTPESKAGLIALAALDELRVAAQLDWMDGNSTVR